MKRKQWRLFLAVTVMAGILGAAGCGNKADDAVSVMASAEADGEMQARTETQTGEAEAGSSGESQDSESAAKSDEKPQDNEPAGEASPDSPAEVEPIENSTPEFPPAFREEMEANINIIKSTIESLKAQKEAERKEAQARAEAERKEAERKEAEARAAEEKAQAEAAAQPATIPEDDIQAVAGVIYDDYSLLEKVNEDRANNGVAELQWSDSLAQYCRDRIPVVVYNRKNGIWAHEGYTKRENLDLGGLTSSEANQDWINSEGHHSARIDSDYTMYAAAAYQDPETGLITWIEAFE